MEVGEKIQTIKVPANISLKEAQKIALCRTPTANYSGTAALQTTKNPAISAVTKAELPDPIFYNEEKKTITVKFSDWLTLIKSHKQS